MKKIIFAALILVFLVIAGCSQQETTRSTKGSTNQPTFGYAESSLYTVDGDILINLNWLNNVGRGNASVMIVQTAVTANEDVVAYVIGEEEDVKEFEKSVQFILAQYQIKSDEDGYFELYGRIWRIRNLQIENMKIEMQKEEENRYYTLKFVRN